MRLLDRRVPRWQTRGSGLLLPLAAPRRALLALCGVGLVAACTSPSPNLYTLAVVPGPTHTGAPHAIALESIGLPHYLERSEIVRSTEDYRLITLPNDWWGESLDSMLGSVLVQALSQRLPGSTVFTAAGAVSVSPDVRLAISIQRFDQDRTGAVILQAQVGVERQTTIVHNLRFTVPTASPAVASLVAAMSQAVGQLADSLAAMLSQH